MTQPQQRSGVSAGDVAAAVLAAQAAAAAAQAPVAVAQQMAEALIASRERVTEWVLNLILGLWRDVDVYDGHAVQAFTEAAAGYMVTAQTVIARQAAATQTQILSSMDIQAPGSASVPDDVRGTPVFDKDGALSVEQGTSTVQYTDGRQIINLDEDASTVGMFNRPARTQRYLESRGIGSVEARVAAEDRLSLLVGDNLMLAQRLAEAQIIAEAASVDERVIGLRRIIHPELSRTGTCGLCIAASDRLYRVRDLVEIHTNCKCTVAAVTEEFDPADELNKADLKALYGVAGGTSGPELKRVRFQVDEHGELGPTLVPAKPYSPRKDFTPGRRRAEAPRRKRDVRI